jgi:hypothetical protein
MLINDLFATFYACHYGMRCTSAKVALSLLRTNKYGLLVSEFLPGNFEVYTLLQRCLIVWESWTKTVLSSSFNQHVNKQNFP